MGVARGELAQTDQVQDPATWARAPSAARRESRTRRSPRPQMGEQRVVLEDDADATLLRRNAHAAGLRDDAAPDGDLSCVRRLEARDQAQRRGLAAAGGAEQREDPPRLERQGEAVHRGRPVGAEALADPRQLEKGHRADYDTGVSGGLPSSTARQFRTARVAMAMRVS